MQDGILHKNKNYFYNFHVQNAEAPGQVKYLYLAELVEVLQIVCHTVKDVAILEWVPWVKLLSCIFPMFNLYG